MNWITGVNAVVAILFAAYGWWCRREANEVRAEALELRDEARRIRAESRRILDAPKHANPGRFDDFRA